MMRGHTVAPYAGADGDGNGIIDVVDYRAWRDNFGLTFSITEPGGTDPGTPPPPRLVAPEPVKLLYVGIGLLIFVAAHRPLAATRAPELD